MGKITIAKNLKCDKWCKLGTRLNVPWKGGWLGVVTNDNGHHQESKFENENEHRHLFIDIFQTFFALLHE
jgi:hypothetical protein